MPALSAPDRYALIGHPVAHSLSPRIHALFAQQTRQNLQYCALELLPRQLEQGLHEFFQSGGRGVNVTVPHKQAVRALLSRLSERAARAGAVNTVTAQGGELVGDNTDGLGLVRDLTHNLRLKLDARRVLLLGAGGASRGVLGPLLEQGVREIVIANRTAERARALANEWSTSSPVRALSLIELASATIGAFDLIINATAGSEGSAPLPPGVLREGTICYDMHYREPSAFLSGASALGVTQIHGGLGMLVEQAAESFTLWRGVRPDTSAVLAALRAQLDAQR